MDIENDIVSFALNFFQSRYPYLHLIALILCFKRVIFAFVYRVLKGALIP